MDPIDRFNRSYTVLESGCWRWDLSRNVKSGYAQFSTSRTTTAQAHRWAYLTFVGPIPEGMTVEHSCHTNDLSCPGGSTCPHRACVNWQDCLTLVSRAENSRRSRKIQDQISRTHCPAGHPYSEANTATYNRMRSCKTCGWARAKGLDPKIVETLYT